MRSIVVSERGGPEKLVLEERPNPEPRPGEILARTHAVGVNFYDTYVRSGVYDAKLPFTPGREASGVVEAVGDGVEGFAAGDRVATVDASGSYAEYFRVKADVAAHVPDDLDLDVAAAVPLQGLTAHYLATSIAPPAAGDSVIVHAGAGGVSLLLTQLLVARGVRVFTTVSTPEKAALSREAGASAVFAYEDFPERVREATGGEGVAVVYDGVGATTFDGSLKSLRVRGTLALFGGSSGQVPPFDIQRLNSGGSLSLVRPSLWHYMRTPEERAWRWEELFTALAEGSLRVRIGARFPLADAAEAHAALEGRRTTGKVILTV
ncbi:quinone oxidoreductase [Salinibacterium sp. SYSU T00001]|uniref:quinone oxidoreductase family protein n=1 Tax=Homoserinimonas sedimenticola TaxID=2986805 RepID=UPI0022356E20|nr:quinone oxidoreductase [Salinibacterium sedimenticola]MCW4386647.1 quinone oxidoreductase [Salinibacterium sedimenticola]